jgi:hypothetical protein
MQYRLAVCLSLFSCDYPLNFTHKKQSQIEAETGGKRGHDADRRVIAEDKFSIIQVKSRGYMLFPLSSFLINVHSDIVW